MKQNDSEYNKNIKEEIAKNNNTSKDNENNKTDSEQNESITKNNEDQITENTINNIDNSINQNTTVTNISENIENNNIINNNHLENNNDLVNNMENNNNEINNESINIPEIEPELEIYEAKLTFAFKLFFILNTFAYIHSNYKTFKLKNYTLCLYPIFIKNQYYRLITSFFYNFGLFDFIISMIGFFFATKYLERDIGSIYTILILFHGLILTSILYIFAMWLFKTIFKFSEYNFDFIFQCGFISIDFYLFLSYFLLKKNYRRNITFSFLDFRGTHSVFFVILIFQLITPSASLVLNLCATLSSFLVFRIFKYFSLPRNYWINDLEKFFGLNKKHCEIKNILGYFSTTENENIINNIKELDYFFDNIE